jgi:hypothetical protein
LKLPHLIPRQGFNAVQNSGEIVMCHIVSPSPSAY